jgi:formylglycine-generating enzyme required for sulfatase activity
MKYEITQGAYVDFLNTLTIVQQTARTRVAPNAAAGTRVMLQGGTASTGERNYIKILKSGVAEYGCDMNNNGILDEEMDGQNVSCAVSGQDLMAYLDFAGLRPMTELEYEKACRGTRDPVPGEFAWGSTYFLNPTAITNVAAVPASGTAHGNQALETGTYGFPHERPARTTSGIRPNILTNATAANAQSMVARNGVFANDSTGRVSAGATYYGIMEMSGNLWEYAVNVANPTGRGYTGEHGDGRIDVGGAHDVTGWPDYFGLGIRGGSTLEAAAANSVHCVSNRANAWWNSNPGLSWNVGGRGVRTAEK